MERSDEIDIAIIIEDRVGHLSVAQEPHPAGVAQLDQGSIRGKKMNSKLPE